MQVQPDIPVLWVDHGYNRPATYQHAEAAARAAEAEPQAPTCRASPPRITTPFTVRIPTPEDEARSKRSARVMKLEPFQRGMKELAPTVWITALRKVQNPNRAGLDIVSARREFRRAEGQPGLLLERRARWKPISQQHELPNEWDYFDPAKADEKRECGLHAAWGGKAVERLKRSAESSRPSKLDLTHVR